MQRIVLLISAFMVWSVAAAPVDPARATRRDLFGAWRLVSIELRGPIGRSIDPFFGGHPSGLLIYDPSGWVSVQIAGDRRPALVVPATRVPGPQAAGDADLKARLLDSYYAYFGRWDFDEANSTVTHTVQSSIYPGEIGERYVQHVRLEGAQLIFERSAATSAGAGMQTKVWERVPQAMPVP